MLYFSIPAPKAWKQPLSVLLLALSLILGPLAHAQSPPVIAWFTPGEFESGDELSLHVEYGSAEIPVPAATQIELTFAYEGFDIVSQPEIDLTDSWFCADGNCDGSITVNNETRELKLVLTRTDGRAQGGYGNFAKGGVIIIEMDEVQMKKEQDLIRFLPDKSKLDYGAPIKITYDQPLRSLKIMGTNPQAISQLTIMDQNGQLLFEQRGVLAGLIPVHLESNKLFLVRLITQEGVYVRKLWLR